MFRWLSGLDSVDRLQLGILIGASLFMIATTPVAWHFTPDSGVYIGTAQSIADTGAYRFNGYPNLLYYPGYSTLLSLTILPFGVSHHAMQGVSACLYALTIGLAGIAFSRTRYGWAGVVTPVVLAGTALLVSLSHLILSDVFFVTLILAAIVSWQCFEASGKVYFALMCAGFVAFSPMVRFEGLVVCIAFGAAMLWRAWERSTPIPRAVVISGLWGALTLVPFALWTARNFVQHTPDTFNMANGFLFGLRGLDLYAPGHGAVDWLDSDGQYFLHRLYRDVLGLGKGILGTVPVGWLGDQVVVVFSLVIAGLGLGPWARRASLMERSLLFSFVFFFLYRHYSAGPTLYIVTRYWLPMLPFVLLVCAIGLARMVGWLQNAWARRLALTLIVSLASLVFVNSWVSHQASQAASTHYAESEVLRERLRNFSRKHIPKDARVAVSDWGVVPLTLERQSYQLLDDRDHMLSLARMAKFQTEYFVIWLGFGGQISLQMIRLVKGYPNLFERMAFPMTRVGPNAALFRVDLAAVDRILAENGHP